MKRRFLTKYSTYDEYTLKVPSIAIKFCLFVLQEQKMKER